jgi:hypothetical protein
MTGISETIGFRFSDEVFLHGLKFISRERYPWKGRSGMKGFFEKLYNHKSVDSYQKIIEWKTALHQEKSQIYHSWALVLRFLSFVLLTSCLVLFLLEHPVLSDVLLITGIILLAFDMFLSRMAAKSRHSWVLITDLLRDLIDQQQKHVKAA